MTDESSPRKVTRIGFDDFRTMQDKAQGDAQREHDDVMRKIENDQQQFADDVDTVQALQEVLPEHPQAVYERSSEALTRRHLAELYQDFATAVLDDKNISEAERVLAEAKDIAQQAGIEWDSLPTGWKVVEESLNELRNT